MYTEVNMFLAVDIGGTKTLLAVFSEDGHLTSKYEFPTSKKYDKFLSDFSKAVREHMAEYRIAACGCAVPGRLDRTRGIGTSFGNLDWHNAPIRDDLQKILSGVPVLLENDGNLAGLSESLLVLHKYQKVLYLTIGTGVGKGFCSGGHIIPELADGEPGHMLIEVGGKLVKWESLVSGHALYRQYGKKASEIDDVGIWKQYAHDLALGMDELIAVFQPDVIIIGGGVGAHFDKFGEFLNRELKKFENDMVDIPPVIQARRPEEAVIYGCYDFIRQQNP